MNASGKSECTVDRDQFPAWATCICNFHPSPDDNDDNDEDDDDDNDDDDEGDDDDEDNGALQWGGG